jgi:hypothetical protein
MPLAMIVPLRGEELIVIENESDNDPYSPLPFRKGED